MTFNSNLINFQNLIFHQEQLKKSFLRIPTKFPQRASPTKKKQQEEVKISGFITRNESAAVLSRIKVPFNFI